MPRLRETAGLAGRTCRPTAGSFQAQAAPLACLGPLQVLAVVRVLVVGLPVD